MTGACEVALWTCPQCGGKPLDVDIAWRFVDGERHNAYQYGAGRRNYEEGLSGYMLVDGEPVTDDK